MIARYLNTSFKHRHRYLESYKEFFPIFFFPPVKHIENDNIFNIYCGKWKGIQEHLFGVWLKIFFYFTYKIEVRKNGKY